MGSVIIVAIVIAAVVFQAWKKTKQTSGAQRREQEMPFHHMPKTPETGSARPPKGSRSQSGSGYSGSSAASGKGSYTVQKKQQTAGGKKKGSAEDSAFFFSRQPVQKENILAAARENTVATAVGNDMDSLASEMLMQNVYDLMVKGPKDSLTFSRDFVSEGTDMLNRYTALPDTDLF